MVSLPGHGETISGFTVTELGFIHMLGAKTAEFYHQASGARLLYIQNDDPELGFNLIYRRQMRLTPTTFWNTFFCPPAGNTPAGTYSLIWTAKAIPPL